MTDHTVVSREEWRAARKELAKLEAEHAELGRKATTTRSPPSCRPARSPRWSGTPAARPLLVDSESTPKGVSIQVYRPVVRPQYATATAD
jgi:hypothetical protein